MAFILKHKIWTTVFLLLFFILVIGLVSRAHLILNPSYAELSFDLYHYEDEVDQHKFIEALNNKNTEFTVSYIPQIKIPFFNSSWQRCTILMLPCLYPDDDEIQIKPSKIEQNGTHLIVSYKIPLHSKRYPLSNKLFYLSLNIFDQDGSKYEIELNPIRYGQTQKGAYPIYFEDHESKVGGTIYTQDILLKNSANIDYEFQNQVAPFQFKKNVHNVLED